MTSIVTLTTDFGLRDAYVAAMKGVMLCIAPDLRIVDISHQIPPQDIMEAAYTLKNACSFFPDKTVHLVVVDPGVGTKRKPICLQIENQWYVGPDNGVFSLLLADTNPTAVYALTNESYWRTGEPSNTFHGRDIFAPVAAHLACGVDPAAMGMAIDQIERLQWALPIADEQGMRGWVLHVDGFGNCIVNIPQDLIEQYRAGRSVKCYVGTAILEGLYRTYAEVDPGEPLLLVDSSGYLEIAVKDGNASELLSIRKGSTVNIVFSDNLNA